MEIVVIGAGISGLTSALRLQRQGHEVEVLEAPQRLLTKYGAENQLTCFPRYHRFHQPSNLMSDVREGE